MAYVDRLLGENERVLARTRQHRFQLLRASGLAFVVALVGVAAAVWLGLSGQPMAAEAGSAVLILGALVLALLAALPGWLRWRHEEYIVTDRRVIQATGVLSKVVLDSSLDKVNDVRLTQSVTGRLFGFGTLDILTASESAVNHLDWIPDPLAFKRALLDARDRAGDGSRAGRGDTAADAPEGAPFPIAERLAQLEDLRRRGLVSQPEYDGKRAELLARL